MSKEKEGARDIEIRQRGIITRLVFGKKTKDSFSQSKIINYIYKSIDGCREKRSIQSQIGASFNQGAPIPLWMFYLVWKYLNDISITMSGHGINMQDLIEVSLEKVVDPDKITKEILDNIAQRD